MKTRFCLLVAGMSIMLACQDLDGPGIHGDIAMRLVFLNDASSSAAPLDSVLVVVNGLGQLTGERWDTLVTATNTTVASKPLLAGQYELALVGYAVDQVDAFELDTVTVVANDTRSVTGLEWSDFFTTIDSIPTPTQDNLIDVSWQPVAGAAGYTVEWSSDSGFASLLATNTENTTTTITIEDLGDHFVRVRATHPLVPGAGRNSETVQFKTVTDLRLEFDQQPPTDSVEAGTTWVVSVQARDSLNQPDTLFAGQVTLAITPSSNATGATLAGVLTRQATAGIATFDDISVDLAGDGYTLTATAPDRIPGTSDAFRVVPAPPLVLAFLVQPPDSSTAGVVFQPAVAIGTVDPFGNVSTKYAGDVAVSITTGTGDASATLDGLTTKTAENGVATFDDLSIDVVASGYTLTATTDTAGIGDAVSSTFAIVPAGAAEWVFTVQPTRTLFGQSISPAVEVTARDAFGNIATGCTEQATVSIASGTGADGAILSGTLSQDVNDGVAVFDNLNIDLSETGYQLLVTGCGVQALSDPFDITAAPHMRVQPIGSPISAGVQFTVMATANDSLGVRDNAFVGSVDIALIDGLGAPAALGGTTSVTAVQGSAAFDDLTIDAPGSGYRLVVSAVDFEPDTTVGFDVVPGPATSLRFVVEPSSATAGAFMTPSVVVEVLDGVGNQVTSFTDDITLTITSGSATAFNNVGSAVAGVATFDSLLVDLAGNHTLTASTGALSQVSAAFDITAAAASMLVFSGQPSSATAGVAIAPDVEVTARDAFGNTATTFSSSIALTVNGETDGPPLLGDTTSLAVNGVATFPGINIESAGTGYVLVASSAGLPSAASTLFDVAPGPAIVLQFAQQPTDVIAGAPFVPAVEVEAFDSFGNAATGFSGDISLAITPGTGTISANLRGDATRPAANGRANFGTISIDSVGTGYTLEATSGALVGDTSQIFMVSHAPPDSLVFEVQPSGVRANAIMTPPVMVTVVDSVGNAATSYAGTVGLGLTPITGDTAAILSGGGDQSALNGRVTFDALAIDSVGTYTMTAMATGLKNGVSMPFNVFDPVLLEFTVQPTGTDAGDAITPAVTVTAKWPNGGTATGFQGSVTLTLIGGNGSLVGTTTVTASAGVASFPGISVDNPGTYQIEASAMGLVTGTSDPFVITAPAPNNFGFTLRPSERSFVLDATTNPPNAPHVSNVSRKSSELVASTEQR